jgi:hypothetical protein
MPPGCLRWAARRLSQHRSYYSLPPSVRVPVGDAMPASLCRSDRSERSGVDGAARTLFIELFPDLSSYACGRTGMLPGPLSPDGRKSVMAASSRTSTFRVRAGRSGIGAEQPPRLHPRKFAVRRKQSLPTMQANCRVRPEGVALKTFASRCSGRRKAAIHSGSHQLTAACRATPLPLSDPRYRPPRISRLFARSPVAVAGAIASDRETPYPFRACRDT